MSDNLLHSIVPTVGLRYIIILSNYHPLHPLPGSAISNIHSPIEAMNKCASYRRFWLWDPAACLYWIYNPVTSECYLSSTVPTRTPTPPEGNPNYRIMGGLC